MPSKFYKFIALALMVNGVSFKKINLLVITLFVATKTPLADDKNS